MSDENSVSKKLFFEQLKEAREAVEKELHLSDNTTIQEIDTQIVALIVYKDIINFSIELNNRLTNYKKAKTVLEHHLSLTESAKKQYDDSLDNFSASRTINEAEIEILETLIEDSNNPDTKDKLLDLINTIKAKQKKFYNKTFNDLCNNGIKNIDYYNALVALDKEDIRMLKENVASYIKISLKKDKLTPEMYLLFNTFVIRIIQYSLIKNDCEEVFS